MLGKKVNQNIRIPNGGKISGDESHGKIPLKKLTQKTDPKFMGR